LGDLESRLKLGPSASPKKEEKNEYEEPVKEEPLTDVRKSRARGPRGRKLPTKEEKPAVAEIVPKDCDFVGVWTVFTLDQDLDTVLVNPVSEERVDEEEKEKESPVSEADASVVKKDDVSALASESAPAEKEDKEEAPTTTTLPGVTGTGEQAIQEVGRSSEPVEEKEDKPTAAEEGNPTLIPTGEHPEDAVEPTMAEVDSQKPTPTEPAPKDSELDPEAAGEAGVAERVVKEG